ncbi:MAG: hypothetical protein GYA16_01550 [Spirochaetes bacterium]|nr:hypothetical protein [Spirochaetota bacterium]
MKNAFFIRFFDLLKNFEITRWEVAKFYLILIISLCLSCRDDKNVTRDSHDEYVLQIQAEAQEIAQTHNEILRMIYENENKNKEKSSTNILERVYHSVREYYERFPKKKINLDESIDFATWYFERYSISSNMELLNNDENFSSIPDRIFLELNHILKTDSLTSNTDNLKLYVNNIMPNKKWSDQELRYVIIFQTMINYSANYWETIYSSRLKLKCSTWVIINDGIGGVLGSAFGGVGGVILGTILSAGTNEECEHQQ